MPPEASAGAIQPMVEVHFHHVQMFVDSLKDAATYRAAATRMNQLLKLAPDGTDVDVAKTKWASLKPPPVPEGGFSSAGQDIVWQMIHGLGWRITAKAELEASHGTRSFLLESQDARGVKFVITAKQAPADQSNGEANGHATKKAKTHQFPHFSADAMTRFSEHQSGRQGIAVLAFEVAKGTVEAIEARYRAKHPALLVNNEGIYHTEGFKILDVFAYYKGEVGHSNADQGAVIRFVQRESEADAKTFLPGLEAVPAEFCSTMAPAYFDHWVSNVVSRTGFLQTLNDTLDFDIKVDFNAGVVAAGEAQIESTVTGNVGDQPTSLEDSLVSQSQVFLPINNALSEVGHVHLFLKEIGQGVQHIASRVNDLTDFITRVNRTRTITGEGFTFLKIPHSYYGRLVPETLSTLAGGVGPSPPISSDLAKAVVSNLTKAGLVTDMGIVDGSATRERLAEAAGAGLTGAELADFNARSKDIVDAVVRARYGNLYKLVGDHLDEEAYLSIVDNQILVDIQNGDILYQIFTCNILQRNPGEEAPFLEFIQRVCSQKKNLDGSCKPIKPGCGGFGIRNFLTLFLSIEVTKAMNERLAAQEAGDEAKAAQADKKIEIFSNQLEESNPILTAITDAMTAQGDAKERVQFAKTPEEKAAAEAEYAAAEVLLKKANADLLECSTRHSEWMHKVSQ